jgi:ankyrin repeat protein
MPERVWGFKSPLAQVLTSRRKMKAAGSQKGLAAFLVWTYTSNMSLLPVLLLSLAVAPARAADPPADPPLVAAVKNGDLGVLKAAIASGAAVGDKDQYGWTAVMWAVGHGGGAMTKALLDAGADPAPSAPKTFNAMIEAAKGGRADVVPLLAARGLSCSAKDELGVPALSYAASQVSTATAAALLACKADVNAKDANGFTPLMHAVQVHELGEVNFLIAAKAQVNARDNSGYTALMWAAHGGYATMASALLAAKADAAVKGNDGRSARVIAEKRGRADVVAVLP